MFTSLQTFCRANSCGYPLQLLQIIQAPRVSFRRQRAVGARRSDLPWCVAPGEPSRAPRVFLFIFFLLLRRRRASRQVGRAGGMPAAGREPPGVLGDRPPRPCGCPMEVGTHGSDHPPPKSRLRGYPRCRQTDPRPRRSRGPLRPGWGPPDLLPTSRGRSWMLRPDVRPRVLPTPAGGLWAVGCPRGGGGVQLRWAHACA